MGLLTKINGYNMTMPSPFEMGRLVGGNLAGALSRSKDTSNLNQILSQAYESQGEEGYDNAMKEILLRVSPENQKKGLTVLQNSKNLYKQKAQQKTYESLGTSIEDSNPQNPFMKQIGAILKSNLPSDEKNNLIKNVGAGVTLRTQQQARLERDSLARHLRDKVKVIDKSLEHTYNASKRGPLVSERKILQDQLDALYEFDEVLGSSSEDKKASKSGKQKFDPLNESHQKVFLDLDKKHKGNKGKIINELKNTYDVE